MKLNPEEDDLIGLTPSNSATTSTDATTAATEPALPDKAINYSLDDDDSLPDEYNRSGGIDFVKPADGCVERFAFIPGSSVAADFVHYSTQAGYVRCNSIRDKGNITVKKLCCTLLPEAKPRRAVYVFTYLGADPMTGKLNGKGDVSVSIKILRASASMWKDIKFAIDEDSTFYSYDFLLGKDPKEKAYSVGIASRKAPAWKSSEKAAVENAAATLANQTPLLKALGKVVSDSGLQAILSAGSLPKGNLADLSSM